MLIMLEQSCISQMSAMLAFHQLHDMPSLIKHGSTLFSGASRLASKTPPESASAESHASYARHHWDSAHVRNRCPVWLVCASIFTIQTLVSVALIRRYSQQLALHTKISFDSRQERINGQVLSGRPQDAAYHHLCSERPDNMCSMQKGPSCMFESTAWHLQRMPFVSRDMTFVCLRPIVRCLVRRMHSSSNVQLRERHDSSYKGSLCSYRTTSFRNLQHELRWLLN